MGHALKSWTERGLELQAAEGVAEGAEGLASAAVFASASVSAAGAAVTRSAVVLAIAAIVAIGCSLGGGAAVDFDHALEAEADALSGDVDFGDGGLHLLADLDDFVGIFDEVVGELADVCEAVLVDADVDEGAECGDVGDDAGELHAFLQVGDFVDAFLELDELKLGAGVASGFGELLHDILKRGEADFFCSVFLDINLVARSGIGHEVLDADGEVLGHLLEQRVAFRVDG